MHSVSCEKATAGGSHFGYSEEVHILQQNDQNLSLANMTAYREGVGGGEPAPPLNPPLVRLGGQMCQWGHKTACELCVCVCVCVCVVPTLDGSVL